MKALSLWQPWASLIYDGRKTIETRHWEMHKTFDISAPELEKWLTESTGTYQTRAVIGAEIIPAK